MLQETNTLQLPSCYLKLVQVLHNIMAQLKDFKRINLRFFFSKITFYVYEGIFEKIRYSDFVEPDVRTKKGTTPLHAAAKSVHDSATNQEVTYIQVILRMTGYKRNRCIMISVHWLRRPTSLHPAIPTLPTPTHPTLPSIAT